MGRIDSKVFRYGEEKRREYNARGTCIDRHSDEEQQEVYQQQEAIFAAGYVGQQHAQELRHVVEGDDPVGDSRRSDNEQDRGREESGLPYALPNILERKLSENNKIDDQDVNYGNCGAFGRG